VRPGRQDPADPNPEVAGIYQGEGSWVVIDPPDLEDATHITTHELCHAHDSAMGDIDVEHADTFQAEDMERSWSYHSDRKWVRESFAQASGGGPCDVGLDLGLERGLRRGDPVTEAPLDRGEGRPHHRHRGGSVAR
jgi:hypothetical protein